MKLKMPVVVTLFGHFDLQEEGDGDLAVQFDHMSSDFSSTVYGLPEGAEITDSGKKKLLRMAARVMARQLVAKLDEELADAPTPAPNNFGSGGASA